MKVGILAFLLAFAFGSFVAKAGSIERADIENIPIGVAMKFAELSSLSAQKICLLQPYQDRLHFDDAFASKVNTHLAAMNYVADEHRFAFVLVGNDVVEVARFNRSQQLDTLAKQASFRIDAAIPRGFVPQDCAEGDFAALIKVEYGGRVYLALGESR